MTQAQDNRHEPYVRAALALQGYAFDEAEIAEIVVQFSRLEAIARTVFDMAAAFRFGTRAGVPPVIWIRRRYRASKSPKAHVALSRLSGAMPGADCQPAIRI